MKVSLCSSLVIIERYRVAIKIEWLKSKERVNRWSEEVLLIPEEMRRVEASLEEQADWWRAQEGNWTDDELLAAGLRAYTLRQADILDQLNAHFTSLWERGAKTEGVELNDKEDADEEAYLQDIESRPDRVVDLE